MPPDALLGPGALLIAALIAVGVLWRSHEAADKRERVLTDLAMSGWREETAAVNRVGDLLDGFMAGNPPRPERRR